MSADEPNAAARREPPPDVGLGIRLRTANIAFNRVLRIRLADEGVSFGQFQHLRHLWEADGLSQAELARRIGIERASSTAVLDGLEKAGLIRRRRDPADRRLLIVHLTPAGKALREPLWDCARRTNADARRGIDAAQIAVVFDALDRMIANLEGL